MAEDDQDLARLGARMKKLEQQVSELRTLMPTFTTMMPNFSERFHVMHRAGEAGDRAVAQHELLEIRRMMAMAQVIDARNGRLMQDFPTEPLKRVAAAVEHQDAGRFLEALDATVTSCNACHDAAGSAFINVGLEADHTLSMRHAHRFLEWDPLGEHMHEH